MENAEIIEYTLSEFRKHSHILPVHTCTSESLKKTCKEVCAYIQKYEAREGSSLAKGRLSLVVGGIIQRLVMDRDKLGNRKVGRDPHQVHRDLVRVRLTELENEVESTEI